MQPPKLNEFDLHGRRYVAGDQIVVRPSAPRHRDGFIARVRAGIAGEDGALAAVELFGAPGKKAPGVRTLRLERLSPVPSPRRKSATLPVA